MREARVVIVGLGLMGGSLAMALYQGGLCREVVGVARRPETVQQALALQAVHYATTQLSEALCGADIVVLATPVRSIIRHIQQLSTMTLPPCLLLDLGSTKQAIVRAMEALPAHVQPLGSHPMCGKEVSGLAAADPNLYRDAPWVLVPLARTSEASLDLARALIQAVGARPLVLDAARHDWLVAAISHLPYVLATALVLVVAQLGRNDAMVWQLAASGFRDTSRLAGSDVEMMLDILMTNRTAVEEVLTHALSQLGHLTGLLARGEEEPLRALLTRARTLRTMYANMLPDRDLSTS
ncbi:MAG: prephenate dehydrogenase/arogenate dehydrogenase family protein [Anaerolineae bacterium]|nr:prephenate dehydrogenase/arogenate dehydrogenase family protein [Anaerolineae bacterium]MDW8070549.1 prephenate dehydrogenase/arogenate dehydrogenase family protein [Anaerolineae bacterium]